MAKQGGTQMAETYEKRMLRVLDYIHVNPDGDLSLDRLADVAAMSRFHWHRVFHAMTGETCAQAVRRVRMNRAACWLVQTDWPVAEIAARVGYPAIQSFGRVFRQTFGLTPAKFRTQGTICAPGLQTRERPTRMYDVTIEQEPARQLAVVPHKGPYLEIGKAFESIGAIATARNLWPDIERMVGVYLDDPGTVAPEDLRSMAGLELKPGVDAPQDLDSHQIAGGKVARLRYVGPYAGLSNAYDYLFCSWLPESGADPDDAPCYEVYINSPAVSAPEELITDICLPLK